MPAMEGGRLVSDEKATDTAMKHIDQAATISDADRELLSELKRVISDLLPGSTMLLYGSAARGEREPESDYDVLVLVETQISSEEEDRVRGAVYDLELAHDAVVSLIFETWERWNRPVVVISPYHQEVERD